MKNKFATTLPSYKALLLFNLLLFGRVFSSVVTNPDVTRYDSYSSERNIYSGVYDHEHDDLLVASIASRMEAIAASNQALRQKIEAIKQENIELMQVQGLLLTRASLVQQLRQELTTTMMQDLGDQRNLLVGSFVKKSDFNALKASVANSSAIVESGLTNASQMVTVVANKTEVLATATETTHMCVMNMFDQFDGVCAMATQLTCTPWIHFTSEGQALCDVENRYYTRVASPNTSLCQGTFPTVIVLAGLQSCAGDIDRVEFMLTRPNGSKWTFTDTTWPYTVFNESFGNGGGSDAFLGEILSAGSYNFAYTIYNDMCPLASANVSFQVNGATACAAGVDHPIRYAGNSHLYSLDGTAQTWSNAKNASETQQPACCSGKAGHLATITNPGENGFVRSLASSSTINTTSWVGLSDQNVEGAFEWVMPTDPFNYTNWANNEPSNSTPSEDCVYVNGDGQWNVADCNSIALDSIVEWDCVS